MDDRTAEGGGISPADDDEFLVAQDAGFDELGLDDGEPADDDAERPVDDGSVDDLTGLDAERRVDLTDEPGGSAGSTD
jgi:hypothetical protein